MAWSRPDGVITGANGALCAMLGYERAQLVGRSYVDLTAEAGRPETESSRGALWTGRSHVEYDKQLVRADGTRIWVHVSATLVDTAGEEREALAALIDIDAQKQVEAENATYRALLEQKNAALRELVDQVQMEQDRTEARLRATVERVILPLVARLRAADGQDTEAIDLLERRLGGLTSGLARDPAALVGLSQRELAVCALIRDGASTKEIAHILGLSPQSVEVHRRNVRKKLGLTGDRITLAAYLRDTGAR